MFKYQVPCHVTSLATCGAGGRARMLSNQCPPICPHGERPESPAATIARLQKEVSESLLQQLVSEIASEIEDIDSRR